MVLATVNSPMLSTYDTPQGSNPYLYTSPLKGMGKESVSSVTLDAYN